MGGKTHAIPLPGREWLLARFLYNPSTGSLKWCVRPREDFSSDGVCNRWNSKYAGKNAGSVAISGHINVGILNKKVYAHRIIWKMLTGEEPAQVDHRNNVGNDNRLRNLRSATDTQNKGNSKCRKNNSVGLKGVRLSCIPGKFNASMSQHRKKVHLGTFDTPEAAHRAYCKAAKAYFGEFWSDGR